jgi:hypothetical protein
MNGNPRREISTIKGSYGGVIGSGKVYGVILLRYQVSVFLETALTISPDPVLVTIAVFAKSSES